MAIRSKDGAFTVDPGTNPLINIAGEADGNTLSDYLLLNNLGYGSVQAELDFFSLLAEGPDPCSNCQLTENGMIQTAGYLYWNDGTTDTVRFQSDVEAVAVPEPSSLILLGSGLLGMGAFIRRQF